MNDRFLQLLANRYLSIKSQFPGYGRRKWYLCVLQEFWTTGLQNQPEFDPGSVLSSDEYMHDDDPSDHILEGEELGILLRTDYSNEDAWQGFYAKLQNSEKELAEAMNEDNSRTPAGSASSQDIDPQTAQGESDSDSSTDGIPSPIIKIINPSTAEDRAIFNNISNLTALRLFNDVDIRPSPTPPVGTDRINPPNRLIDQGGWQEIYSGMSIWIYDVLSNTDGCVRLVSQEGGIYGTATGDSWRARGTHICELQFNISYLGMKIDFGGLDRWDYSERRRNIDESNHPYT